MQPHLPKCFDPIRFADQSASLEGSIPLKQLDKLKDLLISDQGDVQVALQFDRDQDGRRCIIGKVQAVLTMECQRCCQPMNVEVNADVLLSPIISDSQAPSVPKEYSPLVTHGEPVEMADLVADELLLNLPMFTKHSEGECPKNLG